MMTARTKPFSRSDQPKDAHFFGGLTKILFHREMGCIPSGLM